MSIRFDYCNLNETATLSMTVTVRRGVGYVSADENKIFSGNQVGLIAIDSLYSPILRVAYHIEKLVVMMMS